MVALNNEKNRFGHEEILLKKIICIFFSVIASIVFWSHPALAKENNIINAYNPFTDSLQQISVNTQKINNLKTKAAELKLLYQQAFKKYEQLKDRLKNLYAEFKILQNQPNKIAYLKKEIKDLDNKIKKINSKSVIFKSQNKTTTRALYRMAKTFYNDKNYNKAIKYFNAFMRKYKNKTNKLYSHALLYKSESYYIIKSYDKGIVNFNKFILDYPKSKFIPEAILKEGLCFLDIGDKSDGRYLLEKLIKDYPKSVEDRPARMYLNKTKQ
ncbi:MAG: hypothetical protein C0173_04555 [Desulfurella sp.]|uniref:tetratricopeptide repeat protein n=1 Tax=Desulfurella sp. TaxID=1962857 RepID=UPI000CAFF54D|nr:tetratricopeptide repeat protein [Desulfurella sp.]PMP90348.1 MAG: hypothetical protein C0173_04555 [Desulfurella sp.]